MVPNKPMVPAEGVRTIIGILCPVWIIVPDATLEFREMVQRCLVSLLPLLFQLQSGFLDRSSLIARRWQDRGLLSIE